MTEDLQQQAAPTSLANAVIGVPATIFIAGVVPMAFVATTPSGPSHSWMWAFCIAALAGTQYARLIWLGERRLYELSFWLFVYVFLGLAPLVQLRLNVTPTTTPDVLPQLNTTAFMIVVLGSISFAVGVRTRPPVVGPIDIGAPRELNEKRVIAMSLGCLVAAAYYVAGVGITNLVTARQELDRVRAGIWPDPTTRVLIIATGSISLLVAVAALLQVRRQRLARAEKPPKVLLIMVISALLLTVNPISNPRILFGTAALGLAAMAGAFATPRRFRVSSVALLVALLLVFPSADRFRSSTSTAQPLLTKGSLENTLTTGDYDAFSQINNTVYYVKSHGLSYGGQAAGVALFWVPRSIWPSKPPDTGVLLAQFRHYSFTNLSAPLWSELFINGGWPVLMLGMAALGRVVRRTDDHQQVTRNLGVLGCILPFYLIIILRGSLLAATATMAVFIALSIFAKSGLDRPTDISLSRIQELRRSRRSGARASAPARVS